VRLVPAPPEQIVADAGVTVTVNVADTVTVTVCVLLHEPVVPVTVYVVVDAGDAVTDAVLVALRPVPGAHVYVVAPLAISPVLPPGHIVADAGITATVGEAFTVTITVCVPLQPPVVPVTV